SKAQPNDGWLCAQYARSWDEVADPAEQAEVEKLLRRSVQLAPKDWRCWVALGTSLQRKRLYSFLQECAHCDKERGTSDTAKAMERLADIEGSFGEVRQCFAEAVRLVPNESAVYDARAQMHVNLATARQIWRRQQGEEADIIDVFCPEARADLRSAARC